MFFILISFVGIVERTPAIVVSAEVSVIIINYLKIKNKNMNQWNQCIQKKIAHFR